jgi:hypothetical protein
MLRCSLELETASWGRLILEFLGERGYFLLLFESLIDTFLLKTKSAISDSKDSRILVGDI